jgi:hypothetical protein
MSIFSTFVLSTIKPRFLDLVLDLELGRLSESEDEEDEEDEEDSDSDSDSDFSRDSLSNAR